MSGHYSHRKLLQNIGAEKVFCNISALSSGVQYFQKSVIAEFVHICFTCSLCTELWHVIYYRESSTAATNNGADGRKIGDVLLTNMTVLQASHDLL